METIRNFLMHRASSCSFLPSGRKNSPHCGTWPESSRLVRSIPKVYIHLLCLLFVISP